jgi:hypothetical protein
MAELVLASFGGALLNAATASVINWLFRNSTQTYHRLRCFFGGRRGAERIYQAFKDARRDIQQLRGISQDDKRYQIEDLKALFMIRYPHRAYLFTNN